MDEYRLARRVLIAEVRGGQVQGRPRLGCMDGMKVALGSKGIMVEPAWQCMKDRKEWRAQVHVKMIEFHAAIFARCCVLLDCSPVLWWIITWRGVGYCYMIWLG